MIRTRIDDENFDEYFSLIYSKFNDDMLEGRYPSKKLLKYLKHCDGWEDKSSILVLTAFVFCYSGYGCVFIEQDENDEEHIDYAFVTGGWSGNEDVIDAIQSNSKFPVFFHSEWHKGGYWKYHFNRRDLWKS